MTEGDAPRILVVDDDNVIRNLIEDVCITMGYAVDSVCEGRAAWALISSIGDLYELVFLDVLMPGWSGEDVLGMMEVLPKVRKFIVVLTGDLPDDLRLSISIHPSVLRIINKPFSMKDVTDAIELSKTV